MKECNIDVLEVRQVNRIAELRKKIGLRDLTEEQIHKTLWKEYEISGADRMFVERASKILEQYEGESEDEK